jgi:hypothetical protein
MHRIYPKSAPQPRFCGAMLLNGLFDELIGYKEHHDTKPGIEKLLNNMRSLPYENAFSLCQLK